MPRKQARKAKHSRAAGSARRSANTKPRGRPFEPGNPYRWQPGESGNPVGSSRKQILSEALRDVLAQPMPANLKEHIAQMIADGATVAEIISWATASGALKGNVAAVAEIRKATEGKQSPGDPNMPEGDLSTGLDELGRMSEDELDQVIANLESIARTARP